MPRGVSKANGPSKGRNSGRSSKVASKGVSNSEGCDQLVSTDTVVNVNKSTKRGAEKVLNDETGVKSKKKCSQVLENNGTVSPRGW